MSALDFTARALALRATAHNPLSFAELGQARLPETIVRIDSAGHAAPGLGAAAYVVDELASAELMEAHPAAVLPAQAGRHFRLIGTPEGFITPEQLGCPGYAPGVNQQPYIQAAIDYAKAVGLPGVLFTQADYELWTPLRDPDAADIVLAASLSGIPVVITANCELRAAPGGTTFHRRKHDGSDPAAFEGTQWLANLPGGGRWWRGGMFAVHGRDAAEEEPEDYRTRPTFILRGDWTILGGLPRSNNPGGFQGGATGYFDVRPDGTGWDMSDKTIWMQDSWTGDLVLDGYIRFDGFRGELLYRAGRGNGNLIQRGKLELSNSDGSAIDPTVRFPHRFDGEHIHIHHAFQAWERGGGWNNYVKRVAIEDCNLTGSQHGGNADGYDPAGRVPTWVIEHLQVERCGTSYRLMPHNRIGKMTLVDCGLNVGAASFPCHDARIDDLTVICDRTGIAEAVSFAGSPGSGTMGAYNNTIGRITLERTAEALAAGHVFTRSCRWLNSLGRLNFVGEIVGEAHHAPKQASATPDFNVGFGKLAMKLTASSNFHNVETTPTLDNGWAWYALSTTTPSGNFSVSLPDPGKYPPGSRIHLRHQANANVVFSIQTAGTRMNRRMLLVPGTNVEFENHNANAWRPLIEGPKLIGSSGSVNLQKGAAAIPPGDVSDEVTFTVSGAKPGMIVTVTPTSAISADAILIGRIVADNTVGIRARNANLADDVSIGPVTYRVTLEWPN